MYNIRHREDPNRREFMGQAGAGALALTTNGVPSTLTNLVVSPVSRAVIPGDVAGDLAVIGSIYGPKGSLNQLIEKLQAGLLLLSRMPTNQQQRAERLFFGFAASAWQEYRHQAQIALPLIEREPVRACFKSFYEIDRRRREAGRVNDSQRRDELRAELDTALLRFCSAFGDPTSESAQFSVYKLLEEVREVGFEVQGDKALERYLNFHAEEAKRRAFDRVQLPEALNGRIRGALNKIISEDNRAVANDGTAQDGSTWREITEALLRRYDLLKILYAEQFHIIFPRGLDGVFRYDLLNTLYTTESRAEFPIGFECLFEEGL